MKNTEEFKFECTRCGNCCTDKNTIVNVTYFDILRIKNGLNLSIDEILETLGFFIFDKMPSEEELKKMIVPPIETENGLAFTGLNKRENGSCYFYNIDEKKCMIYNLRPKFCRTFPFTFSIIFNDKSPEKAKIKMSYTVKSIEYCPGIGTEAPLVDEDKWIQVGKETIEDLSKNNVLIKKWNEAVKFKKVSPSTRNYLLTIFNLND